jgi:phospholipid/cholesterol/gamma-HCH transport system ATP-binding protein
MDDAAKQKSEKSAEQPIIRFENVCKRFGKLVVFEGLNLDVKPRECLVVLGPSGTGKSVLLKHIVGLLKPDKGAIYFKGERIDTKTERQYEPIRRHFGFLFQQGALFDSMSVADNIAFPLREGGERDETKVQNVVKEKLSMVGLESSAAKMPSELSGGQRKRVALARAIALDPEVVLYDEPTTGLDPIRSDVINELILKLNDELHVTSVVVTHDMTSAFKVADRMVMLTDGKVIFSGTAADIKCCADERVKRFVEGRATAEELEAIRRAK